MTTNRRVLGDTPQDVERARTQQVADKLPTITFLLMGSFSRIDRHDLAVALLPMLIGFAILVSQSWKLNVLSFGEEEARSMGIDTGRVRILVILASTMLVSCTVAVAGVVGWVGLVIPHLARAVVGPNYRRLPPTSILIGAAYLLAVDDIQEKTGIPCIVLRSDMDDVIDLYPASRRPARPRGRRQGALGLLQGRP